LNLNSKRKVNNKIKISYILLFFFLWFFIPTEINATDINYEIKVSASIGEPKLTLFGYSSPQGLIQLQGDRVDEQVIADEKGYFFFDRIFLPLPNPEYPELCLTTTDTQSRASFPTCLPRLPIGNYLISVGPVLLPPTVSLDKGIFITKEQIKAQGLTIPNSEVNIFLANDQSKIKRLSLVKSAHAYNLPSYKTVSDQNGYFEFNLPNEEQSSWKMFAGANFLNSPTPKSNTLNFKIIPWWLWFIKMVYQAFISLLGLLKPSFWLIILLEIMAIFYLFKKHHDKKKENQKIIGKKLSPFEVRPDFVHSLQQNNH